MNGFELKQLMSKMDFLQAANNRLTDEKNELAIQRNALGVRQAEKEEIIRILNEKVEKLEAEKKEAQKEAAYYKGNSEKAIILLEQALNTSNELAEIFKNQKK